jgi:hypothetical protein
MNLRARLEKLERRMPEQKLSEDGPTLEAWKKSKVSHDETEKFYERWEHSAWVQQGAVRMAEATRTLFAYNDASHSACLTEQEKIHELERQGQSKQKALERLAKYHPELLDKVK